MNDPFEKQVEEALKLEKRQKQLQSLLDQGKRAAENGDLLATKKLFLEARSMNDVYTPAINAVIVGALFKAGEKAESNRNPKRAASFYETVLEFDEDNQDAPSRLTAMKRRKTAIWMAIGFVLIVLGSVFLSWLSGVAGLSPEACDATGNIICTPTPTHTHTPTPTHTYTPTPSNTPTHTTTNTPTPTNTSTSTSTPTATFTPTMTPTPSPFIGEVNGGGTIWVYVNPVGDTRSSLAQTIRAGTQIYLCAYSGNLNELAGSRYQIAQGHCHLNEPLGWVDASRIQIVSPLNGVFPETAVTPAPLLTSTPPSFLTPTPTSTQKSGG